MLYRAQSTRYCIYSIYSTSTDSARYISAKIFDRFGPQACDGQRDLQHVLILCRLHPAGGETKD